MPDQGTQKTVAKLTSIPDQRIHHLWDPCILRLYNNLSGCGSWVPQHLATYHFECAKWFFLKLPVTDGEAPGLHTELSCERKSLLTNHRGRDH